MLTAIIVDDEIKVCHLIQNLIPWDKMGIDIVGIVNDGKTAYNFIHKNEPDIVITDIRMPGFNGIDLIKNIKELGLSTRFIIISGYRHFEYAHRAIKYGVEEYLLKPLKKEELKSAIEKIKGKIDNTSKGNEHHLISYTIFNPQKTIDIIERDINLNHKNAFKTGRSNVIFLKIDSSENKDKELIDNILEKVSKITENTYRNTASNIFTYIMHYGIICVINHTIDDVNLRKNNYKTLFESVNNYLGLFENFSLSLGIGESVSSLAEISISIKKAINTIIYRISLGTNKIIFSDDIVYEDYNIDDVLTKKRENALINSFETLNKGGIEKNLLDIFSNFKFRDFFNPFIIIELSNDIMNQFIQVMKKFGLGAKREREFRNSISTGIDRALSIDEIYNFLLHSIYKQINIINNWKKNEDNRPIREAKNYIHDHYKERLTLSEVAEVVHLNSDYLSSIFKKEVGINFSDYLINYRLDKAKDLLINTDRTIAFISNEVGYTDSRYFSKLFKERIGIKPSEYRKLYS